MNVFFLYENKMTSSKNKILEEILPVRIIREVEKWPVLYMRDCPEVPNTHFRKKVWNEVAKALIEDWDSYSPAEKECKIMDLTKKWRNLKDTFKRQLIVDKKRRQGQDIKKRKYVYFKHMSFLLPHMEPEEDAHAPRRPRRRAARPALPANPALPAPPAPEYVDEDRHFLMSLLPSFRRMSDDEKLSAKMDILRVIKEVRNQAAAMDSYCQLQLDEPLAVKNELFDAGESSALGGDSDYPTSINVI